MPRRVLALCLAIVALLFGCSRMDPVSTDHAGTDVESAIRADASRFPAGFYPLAIGNRWRLHRDWSAKFIGDDPPWWLPMTGSDDYEFEQICTEVRGLPYIVEQQTWWNADGDGGTWHKRYRQDPSGLYEADLCLCEPPECGAAPRNTPATGLPLRDRLWERMVTQIPDRDRAAAWASFDAIFARIDRARTASLPIAERSDRVFELTILKYPLYPGQSWAIRNDGDFMIKAGVEAFEVIDLPVGRVLTYRVRIDPGFDSDDVFDILQWWGRCGLMRSTMHTEGKIIGEDGEPIGTLIWDEIQDVTDINLVDLRPCTIEKP